MANYGTVTSDKSKAKAKKLLLYGGLGLHYFYVGRIKAGIGHFLLGLISYIMIIGGVVDKTWWTLIIGLLYLAVANLIDLYKISMGKFKDNVGQFLRE